MTPSESGSEKYLVSLSPSEFKEKCSSQVSGSELYKFFSTYVIRYRNLSSESYLVPAVMSSFLLVTACKTTKFPLVA